jgi:hypothetical protein
VEIAKVMLSAVDEHVEVDSSISIARPSFKHHWASNNLWLDLHRSNFSAIQDAQYRRFCSETFASDLNVLLSSISRPTLWERSINIVKAENVGGICKVGAVEG